MKLPRLLWGMLAVYLVLASAGVVLHAPMWDEGVHNFAVFVAHDFLRDGPGLHAVEDYALDYNKHYSFYSSIFYHPPAYKALVLAFMFLAGPGILAIRLPTVLLGLLSILLAYLTSRELGADERTSLLAAGLFAFSHAFLQMSVFGNIDVAVVSIVMASLYFFVRYEKTGRPRMLYLAALFTGIAFNFKLTGLGPVLVIGLYYLVTRRARNLVSREFLVSVGILALLAIPWLAVDALKPFESISTTANFIFQGRVLELGYWPSVLFNLVYFVSLPGLVLLFLRFKPREKLDWMLLSWIAVYFFAFIFVYDYPGGFARLALSALFPVMFLVARTLSNEKRLFKAVFLLAFLVQTSFFLYAFNFSPPAQEAVDFTLDQAAPGSAIVITNGNQQLSMMSLDRKREFYALWFSGDLDRTFSEYQEKKGPAEFPEAWLIADSMTLSRESLDEIESSLELVETFPWQPNLPDMALFRSKSGSFGGISVYRFPEVQP